MPERKPSAVVRDILTCIDHIQTYTGNLSFDDFATNFMAVEACLYNIQIIGEAVSRLPDEIKRQKQIFPGPSSKACATGLFTNILEQTCRWFGTQLKMICPHSGIELEKIQLKLLNEGR